MAIWVQPPGARPRSTTAGAGLEEAVLVVDLGDLEGRAAAVADGAGLGRERVVDLAFQPGLLAGRALLGGLQARGLAPAASTPPSAASPCVCGEVVGHSAA
jgi:hypothetical protein